MSRGESSACSMRARSGAAAGDEAGTATEAVWKELMAAVQRTCIKSMIIVKR